MRKIHLLFCLLIIGKAMMAQFVVCNSGTTNALKDVHFIDENVGVAVGDSGTILRSIDGGLNWSSAEIETELNFVKVDFFDDQNGIAITTGFTIGAAKIFTTDNAGQSWSTSNFVNDRFFDVAILPNGNCVITGVPNAVIRSTDFGYSWETLVVDENPSVANFGLVSFIDDNVGFCWPYSSEKGDATKKTTDGGETWTTIVAAQEPNNTVKECVSFISDQVGFQGGWYEGHLNRTMDGGNSWQSLISNDVETTWEMLDFHITAEHPNAYYASGWFGDIKKSVDGGETWFNLYSGVENRLYGIDFITEDVGWVVGYNGVILKTENGGDPTSIQEFDNHVNLTIYPNPTVEYLNIDNPDNLKISMIKIVNAIGQVVFVSTYESQVIVRDLARGKYTIGFVMDDGTINKSFVKE